jgi:hypothetical protein
LISQLAHRRSVLVWSVALIAVVALVVVIVVLATAAETERETAAGETIDSAGGTLPPGSTLPRAVLRGLRHAGRV